MDEDLGTGGATRDLVVAFPDWPIDAEEARMLASVVSVTAGAQLGELLNAEGTDERLRIARGTGQRVRERLFDSRHAADRPAVFDLVAYLDKLTVLLAGPAPDLDRFAEQLRYFIDHLNRIGDRSYPRRGREI